jgi:repressor LexA
MIVNGMIHLCIQMGKADLKEKEVEALRHLRNALVHEGYSPSVRELSEKLGYRSPRSAFLILNNLIEKGWVERRSNGSLQLLQDLPEDRSHARTIDVPLVGSVPCGVPMLAEENIEAWIPVSVNLARPGGKYYLLRAHGDSMDKAGIRDGDLLLVRQQPQADNGNKIVALINDEATVKEFHREKNVVVLKPRSKNRRHKPIVLTEDFLIQGVVVSTLPSTVY